MTTPYALGRIVDHDERSRDFPAMVAATKPVSVLWDHHAPVLDQGDLGACTGFALTQWLNTDYVRRRTVSQHIATGEAVTSTDHLRAPYGADVARKLYSQATRLDRVPGYWPPTDTGSSGLAVCKAGVRQGFLIGYRHAFGFQSMLMALQHSPVIVGTEWAQDMFTPDRKGIIQPYGDVVGGHEYLVIGCDMENRLVTILNSWSDTWGLHGRASIPFDSFEDLLSRHGDVTVPVIA